MSAILSADDLNDFISPGVACIKPIETLPVAEDLSNPYEVTTEEKVTAANAPPAQISLTDCLACSGCVTSAEAVLVSLQSHTEVLNTIDAHPSLDPHAFANGSLNGSVFEAGQTTFDIGTREGEVDDGRLFVASVSPQARASLAATYGISERQAGFLIEQLLSGPHGLKSGGPYGSSFAWVIDTNTVRDATLVLAADEVIASLENYDPTRLDGTKKPILTSACPGWICYAEKTHPYVLPHLSRLKSPQALAGTLLKSVLSQKFKVPPHKIWHLTIMPCFDKKLEASRTELTSEAWLPAGSPAFTPTRDVDCVITPRELVHLASARGLSLSQLPRSPVQQPRFPDTVLSSFLFPRTQRQPPQPSAGPSGGYLHHIIHTIAAYHPGTQVQVERGRNADVLEYKLINMDSGKEVMKMARYYGFRNIQNLVRRLKPKTASRMPGAVRRAAGVKNGTDAGAADYAYVEVMACPGGCTNGGGQVKVAEVSEIRGDRKPLNIPSEKPGPKEQKEWLAKVDEAYFSAESSDEAEDTMDVDGPSQSLSVELDGATTKPDLVDGISHRYIQSTLEHWSQITCIDKEKLLWTSFREVESDVGKSKSKKSDMDRVVGLASSIGGGW